MKVITVPMWAKYVTTYYPVFTKVILDSELYNEYMAKSGTSGDIYTWGNYNHPSWDYPDVLSLVSEQLHSNLFQHNEVQLAINNKLPAADVTEELKIFEEAAAGTGAKINKFFIDSLSYTIITSQVKNQSMQRTFPNVGVYNFGSINYNSSNHVSSIRATAGNLYTYTNVASQSNGMRTDIYMSVLPDDYFVGGKINPDYDRYDFPMVRILCSSLYSGSQHKYGWIKLSWSKQRAEAYYYIFKGATDDLNNLYPDYMDYDNPYSKEGNSGEGGGDGTLDAGGLDSIQGASVPGLPSVSACDVGFITMYNPTGAQLKALSSFMWSDAFDIATYKKIFSDPMESIIGLSVIPVSPSIAGEKHVMFGTIDSGVSMSYLSSQWVQKDCGWVDIEKFVGCFMDADPYTKIQIFLPAIGFRQLSADDINGGSIRVVYNIDCLTGACAAFIEHSSRGVLYSYNGSMICNIPLTAINFSGAIQNAVSAVISGVGTVAGMATGAAPITAMGAMGLLNSAANTALNSKPSVQRSGNMGGSAGIMGILTPYVVIERPKMSVPYEVEHYAGQACNINVTLGACEGFTVCEYVHVEGTTATSEEVKEIEALLKEGVYL